MIDAIAEETGESPPVLSGARREGDPAELVADASLSRSELGFEPRLSDLKTIIKTAWAWHRRAHPKKKNSNVSGRRLTGFSPAP